MKPMTDRGTDEEHDEPGRSQEAASETIRSRAVQLLAEVDSRVGAATDFAERERALHAIANDAIQCAQQKELQSIADRFVSEEPTTGRGTDDEPDEAGRAEGQRVAGGGD